MRPTKTKGECEDTRYVKIASVTPPSSITASYPAPIQPLAPSPKLNRSNMENVLYQRKRNSLPSNNKDSEYEDVHLIMPTKWHRKRKRYSTRWTKLRPPYRTKLTTAYKKLRIAFSNTMNLKFIRRVWRFFWLYHDPFRQQKEK